MEGMCTIKDHKGHTMATIPWADGLYQLVNWNKANTSNHINVAAGKMSISEAHWKLGLVSHTVIKNAISTGWITGIDLDMELKPDFCKPCTKGKSTHLPFPKKSDSWATEYGKHVHWDLWGPTSVKSLSGNSYCATCIDNHSGETSLYVQPYTSNIIESYKRDEALMETHSVN